jgi:predicted kinase
MNKKIILRPCIVVLSGLPLSGKSFLAEKLLEVTNLCHMDVDTVRNTIDESRGDGLVTMLEPDRELEVMIKSYEQMCKRTEELIQQNLPVLISGTFSRNEFKQPLERLVISANNKNIPVKLFLLTLSDREAQKRIEKRKVEGSLSNIDSLEKYNWAKKIFNRIEFVPIKEIDTSYPGHWDELLEELEYLKKIAT